MVLSIDLECYDYNKGSTSLIRATVLLSEETRFSVSGIAGW